MVILMQLRTQELAGVARQPPLLQDLASRPWRWMAARRQETDPALVAVRLRASRLLALLTTAFQLMQMKFLPTTLARHAVHRVILD